MGRRGEFSHGNGTRKRKRIRSKEKGSDDSDEDYVLGVDESDEDNLEAYCASSSRDISEESFDFSATSCSDGSPDEVRKAVRSKPRKGFAGQGKLVSKRRKCGVSMVLADSEGEDDGDEEFNPDADDCLDDDEEFIPDADDCLDDEEESLVGRKSRVRNRVIRRKGSSKSRKTKRKSKKKKKKNVLSERPGRSSLKRVVSSDDDFVVEDRVSLEKNRKKGRRRKKRTIVHSDSDFIDSGSSDFECRFSEEERDFIKELARDGNLTTCLRSSSLSKRLRVDGASPRLQQQRTTARKGKEKVDNLQPDTGKQVCGICLSEEQKGIIRGMLNSCFHYFCFTCIMEWSKVESRCPVCKQRFTTISKPARSDVGIGLRKAVLRVPIRDQVYRPSEEEMRSYLDPYENVVCIECQQGGDDSLMLLCDICDSPAHTYCVGLENEVPEGNWYCEGCKSSVTLSSNSHVRNLVPDQGTINRDLCTEHSASGIDAEGFDTRSPPYSTSQHPVSLPEQSFPPGIDILASPRYHVGEDIQFASPRSGAGASTVLGRRRLRRHIHNLISTSRMFTEIPERTNGLPHASLANDALFEIEQDPFTFENAKSLGSGDSCSVAVEHRVQVRERSSKFCGESPSSIPNGDAFSARTCHMRKHVIHDLNTVSSDGLTDDSLCAEQEGINSLNRVLAYKQYGQPIVGSSSYISPHTYGEGCSSHSVEEAEEQIRVMVKRHLKLLSRDTELERCALKDIDSHSTHTILSVCGFKPSRSMTISVQPPSECFHIEKEGRQMSLIKGCCSSCFDSFVRDAVLNHMKMKLQQ